ncbi:MAG: hypothetical protein HYU84_07250 [Chloroflexi bacterium]|nr:hypothetical protein [Chloroflexota bacterium]MBI3166876.1 hypothetical protein [Chloroflexota bacterium]
MKKSRPVLLLLALILTTLACGVGGNSPEKQATLDAISAQVRGTGTASAVQGSQPTQPAGDASSESLTATAAAFAPILAELPKYGVDPSEGNMAWVHQPVSLDASGYHHFEYVNNFIGTLAQDFVISSDITWNTVGSTSGCGFVLRSDGNENALDQYVAIITRVASGHFLFATMSDGEVVTGRDMYARYKDKTFRWENDTTNRLTIVGRGNHFWVYTNDTLIGEVDPSAPPPQPNLPPEPDKPANQSDPQAMAIYEQQKIEHQAIIEQIQADYAARQRAYNSAETVFERGFMAMVALSESGRTTNCKFDNTWLFLIDSP